MNPQPDKAKTPIPVSIVTYRVKKPDQEEIRRVLGRDLEDAMRSGKAR